MKKAYIIGGIIAVLLAVAVVLFVVINNTSAPASNNASNYTLYDACEVLTEQEASEVLGTTNAVKGDEAAPVSSDDLKVTSCTYNNGAGSAQTIVSATLLVRSPLTDAGAASNRNGLEDGTIVGNVPIEGYGDKAVWNPDTGQLNVLKENTWFIISYGKVQPSSHSLDDVKKIADKIF